MSISRRAVITGISAAALTAGWRPQRSFADIVVSKSRAGAELGTLTAGPVAPAFEYQHLTIERLLATKRAVKAGDWAVLNVREWQKG